MTQHQVVRQAPFTVTRDGEGGGAAADGRTLSGYAAVFGAETIIDSAGEGRFHERIEPGAFARSLQERKPVMQFNHGRDPRFGGLPIGSIKVVREDERGLYVQARLFDSAEAIREAISAGAISGMSFRFAVTEDAWTDAQGRSIETRHVATKMHQGVELHRAVKAVQLYELGPVTFPAYASTTVDVRSASGAFSATKRNRLIAMAELHAWP
jgi:HK97 family phage prohead protease